MLIYIGVVFYTKWAFQHFHPTGFRVYVLALLPALPMVASLIVVGLYISEEADEFQRSIIIRSVLWGLGASLAVGTVWGTLEDFAHARHLSTFLAYLSFWIVMAISGVIIRLRYR
jgi:xanthosine utilization system XapX-like protein